MQGLILTAAINSTSNPKTVLDVVLKIQNIFLLFIIPVYLTK